MKNLRLRIKEDGNIYVSAPYGVSKAVIDSFVESRSEWIAEQRSKLCHREPPKTELNDGDVITVLGREYVVTAVSGEGDVFIEGRMLTVPVSDMENTVELEQAVLGYMAALCRRVCSEAVFMYLRISGYRGERISLQFKLLKSRWGSYNRRDNTITFNLALCKLPERFIKYVAAHEVTHIFVHNHSEEFYRKGESLYEGFLRTDRELNKIKISGIFS